MPLASVGVRSLTQSTSSFTLPSTFQGGGVQVSLTESNQTTTQEQAKESRPTRTVTFQNSGEELTPPHLTPNPPEMSPAS